MNTEYIYLIACAITVVIAVVKYERQIKKVKKEIQRKNQKMIEMIMASERAIIDLEVMLEMLKDTYTDEEIDTLYDEKKKEYLMKRVSGFGDVE